MFFGALFYLTVPPKSLYDMKYFHCQSNGREKVRNERIKIKEPKPIHKLERKGETKERENRERQP